MEDLSNINNLQLTNVVLPLVHPGVEEAVGHPPPVISHDRALQLLVGCPKPLDHHLTGVDLLSSISQLFSQLVVLLRPLIQPPFEVLIICLSLR